MSNRPRIASHWRRSVTSPRSTAAQAGARRFLSQVQPSSGLAMVAENLITHWAALLRSL